MQDAAKMQVNLKMNLT